jgi:hypothetical protein
MNRLSCRVPAAMLSSLVALTPLFALAACAGTGTAAQPSCQQPGEAVMPGAAGSLDETSTGAYCLQVGQSIDVFLHAQDPKTTRWAAVTSSDPTILQPQRTGVLTAPVGVTPGIFGGLRAGTATLTSTQSTGQTWTVTIVVQ